MRTRLSRSGTGRGTWGAEDVVTDGTVDATLEVDDVSMGETPPESGTPAQELDTTQTIVKAKTRRNDRRERTMRREYRE
jgi:hypothetical protein